MPIITPTTVVWIKGKAYAPSALRFLDEAGHELHHVIWIDTDKQTFGQLVVDDEGLVEVDPEEPLVKGLEIVRYGRVRMEPR